MHRLLTNGYISNFEIPYQYTVFSPRAFTQDCTLSAYVDGMLGRMLLYYKMDKDFENFIKISTTCNIRILYTGQNNNLP